MPWQHIGVTDQIDIADGLDAHHADQSAAGRRAPERDASGDLAVELGRVHVRVVPAVGGDHAAIGLGGRIHDRQDVAALVAAAEPDAAHRGSLPRRRYRNRLYGSSSVTVR
jgi:hypothetical protein